MSVLNDLTKLKQTVLLFQSQIEKSEELINNGAILDANNELFSLEKTSEKIVNISRNLPSAIFISDENSEELDKQIVDTLKFSFSYLTNGGFYIKMFSLLPKKNGGNAIYVRASISLSLSEFFKNNKKVMITEPSTLVVKHNYDKTRPEKEYRDHDNIELNVIIDALAMNLLPDDSPLTLRHYYFSKPADEDSTEIFLIPNKNFIDFLESTI